MSQPIKKAIKNPPKASKKETTRIGRIKKARARAKGNHEFGTSKLEERFASNILDKLGIDYVYQYKAESIGRYFDFRVCIDGQPKGPIIECDGDFWHSNPLIYEGKGLTKTQIRDKKIDEIKNKWCSRNGIPLIRVWETDINKHPKDVTDYLKIVLKDYIKK